MIQLPKDVKEIAFDNLPSLHGYISEILEKVQFSICQTLKMSFSFVLSRPNIGWLQLHQAFTSMSELFQRGIGLNDEIIIVDKEDNLYRMDNNSSIVSIDIVREVYQLRNLLEAGNKSSFLEGLESYFNKIWKSVFVEYELQLEVFSSLSTLFLSYMNSRKITRSIGKEIELEYLINLSKSASWQDLKDYYISLTKYLFGYMEIERLDQRIKIIEKVDSFIVTNLNGDLSLDNLAKQVYLSPYYLSRMYHSEKGCSLSETIAHLKIAKAKVLLLKDGLKIQDVALEMGFDNVPYFTKFFKKHIGVTPQEYKLSNNI